RHDEVEAGIVVLDLPAQLAARREHVAHAGEDQRARLSLPGELVHVGDGLLEAVVHRGAERVARLRPVDGAVGEMTLALEAQERSAEVDDRIQRGAASKPGSWTGEWE